ncbi:MAG TPA: hypothetical protein VEJ87_13365, partial [Acidimicrobiales bacterium]|nr:hypothetical protein [Acidimicrobiales bacterium]
LPERPVSAIFNDHLDVWTRGSCNRVVPFTGETDLGRLLAWARVTVDLRPGRLFARASLISLRYGTPIVVPELSRAKQHAEDGGCGLWYRDGAEMLEGLSLLLDESKGTRLGKSGALYTKEHFGSPSLFRDRTLAALRGINDESAPTEVLQG